MDDERAVVATTVLVDGLVAYSCDTPLWAVQGQEITMVEGLGTPGIALPPSVAANPRLGDWLRVLPAGVIDVRPGKVELGQGVLTALAQVAAEELDVSLGRVRMMPAVTGMSPDEGAAGPCSCSSAPR